jgi:predicted nucleic acid-binding protein
VIAYFDSSSIVKWFFDEPYMDFARSVRDEAGVAFTSLVSFPEVMSAFNRAWKEKRCSRADVEKVRKELIRIWPAFRWVKPAAALIDHSGELVFKHDLRGMDALHLASALLLKQEAEGAEVFFSCFDQRLNHAAHKERLLTHQECR